MLRSSHVLMKTYPQLGHNKEGYIYLIDSIINSILTTQHVIVK